MTDDPLPLSGAHRGPHKWQQTGDFHLEDGKYPTPIMACSMCGAKEPFLAKIAQTVNEYGLYRGDRTAKDGRGKLVEDVGGIVAFDPERQMIQMGDGTEMTFESLVYANPNANPLRLMASLETLPKVSLNPTELAKRIQAQAFIESMAEASKKPSSPFSDLEKHLAALGSATLKSASQTNAIVSETRAMADDAVAFIIDAIKAAKDPRAEAANWLTRVTSAIGKVIRQLDSEEEERESRG